MEAYLTLMQLGCLILLGVAAWRIFTIWFDQDR